MLANMHTRMHSYTHTHAHAHKCCMFPHTPAFKLYPRTHADMHPRYTYTPDIMQKNHMCIITQTCTQTHTHAHAHTQVHMHAQIHTHRARRRVPSKRACMHTCPCHAVTQENQFARICKHAHEHTFTHKQNMRNECVWMHVCPRLKPSTHRHNRLHTYEHKHT